MTGTRCLDENIKDNKDSKNLGVFGVLSVLLVLVVAGGLAYLGRLTAPDPTLLLRDRHGTFLAEIGSEGAAELGYWPLERLPERVVAATLISEDRRFWDHPGVDVRAVARAMWLNLRNRRRVSGASTIAMQVARMQQGGRRTYWRKALEAVTAGVITARYGRQAVLAHYLRIVPYGHRIHGIAYAARRYFDKPVEDLSWAEIAFLTAIPQAPSHMDPYRETGRARAIRRARRTLDALRADGQLDPGEYDLAVGQLAALRPPPLARRPRDTLHAILRLQRVLSREASPARPLVDTSIDLDVQRIAARAVADGVGAVAARGAGNGAAIVLDRQANAVRAWVGSTDYYDKPHRGAVDYTQVRRSPGSTLKPFIYALGLERGVITPATMLDDVSRPRGDIINADESFLGPLLPRVALANSRNVPAAAVLADVGLDSGYAFFRELGLHQGERAPRDFGLGMSIGTLPVTLEHLVRAYGVLARDGQLADLVWYAGQPTSAPRRTLMEDTARQVTLFLSDPMARMPSFPRMGSVEYPFPVAVKTGTSSRYRDALTVAYSSRYVVAVWIGHPDQRPMNRLAAATSAAEVARAILGPLHRDQSDGLSDLPFPPPHAFRAQSICALSGKRATPGCDHVVVEWFRPGEEPLDDCEAHVERAVDTRDGTLATALTPAAYVAVRRFVALPARYATWANAARMPIAPIRVNRSDQPSSTRISIVSPVTGERLMLDPESPPQRATLTLRAVVDPPSQQLVWYVDGVPFQLVDFPYVARWPMQRGTHIFQARMPFGSETSAAVHVAVQ